MRLDSKTWLEPLSDEQVETLEHFTFQADYIGWQGALKEYLDEGDADAKVVQAFVEQWNNGSFFI